MPDSPLNTLTISLVVIPAISGVPVPGAWAGSNTSISIDKYSGLSPTLFLILSTILSIPSVWNSSQLMILNPKL